MDENLLHILSWKNPLTSVGYLVAANLLCWFMHYERPMCIIPLVLLMWFGYSMWKYRIKSEILINPPDHEDWITISTYEFRTVANELVVSFMNAVILLRQHHYFMWFISTSVFWIVLAKLSSILSFYSIFFITINAGFILGLVFSRLEVDFIRQLVKSFESPSEPGRGDDLGNFGKKDDDDDLLLPSRQLQRKLQTDATHYLDSFLSLTVTQPEPEPESLTMSQNAQIPSHEDSSEDEFLFDADHFKSSSSSGSTDNSFELLHF